MTFSSAKRFFGSFRTFRGRTCDDLIAITLCVVVVYVGLLALVIYTAPTRISANTFIIGEGGSDTQEYVELGQNLLSEHRFTVSTEKGPEYFRTPGYPAFIALMLALFGSPLAIAFAQIVLSALSACLIYVLGIRWFSRGIGIAAAAFYAIDPTVVLKAFTAYTETLFVFVLLCATVLIVDERATPRRVCAGGLFLGFFAIVRPVGLYVIPLFFLWLFWEFRRDLKAAAYRVLICLFGVVLIAGPWMLRNDMRAGYFSLSSIGTYNALYGNVAEYEVYATGRTKEAVWHEFDLKLHAEGKDPHSYEFHAAEKALVFDYLRGHWISYAVFHTYKTVPFFVSSSIGAAELTLYQQGAFSGLPPGDVNLTGAILSHNINVIWHALAAAPAQSLEMLLWVFVWLSAIVPIFLARGKTREVAIFFWLIALLFAALTGPISMPPYRMPVEPFLFLLASSGVVYFLAWYRGMVHGRS